MILHSLKTYDIRNDVPIEFGSKSP